MREQYIVECESYQIKVDSPDVNLSETDITDYIWKQADHNPLQLGGEFDSYTEAYVYARDCKKNDYPTCQKLFGGGYVICGNVYMAESLVVDEDGELVDYRDCTMLTNEYKGKE